MTRKLTDLVVAFKEQKLANCTTQCDCRKFSAWWSQLVNAGNRCFGLFETLHELSTRAEISKIIACFFNIYSFVGPLNVDMWWIPSLSVSCRNCLMIRCTLGCVRAVSREQSMRSSLMNSCRQSSVSEWTVYESSNLSCSSLHYLAGRAQLLVDYVTSCRMVNHLGI